MIARPDADSDFYFLKHGKQRNWSTQRNRNRAPSCIVMHTAESANLVAGLSKQAMKEIADDDTAERVARYGATTSRQVSWHVVVDSNSIIWCLPDRMKAWHASSLNSASLGIELACRSDVWSKPSTRIEWVDAIIENAASVVALWCSTYGIPAERITREQAFRDVKGIIAHGDADPTRRSDPGADFPWLRFMRAVRERLPAAKIEELPEAPRAEPVDVTQENTIVIEGIPVLTAEELLAIRRIISKEQ